MAEGFGLVRNFIQEMRVHIRADAEAKDARIGFVLQLHAFENHVFIRVSDSRPVIREKNEHIGAILFLGPDCQGFFDGIIDRGAAHRLQVYDEASGFLTIAALRIDQLAEERFDLGRESDNLEPVLLVKVLHAKQQCFFGLFQFGARHGAGGIQHEGHVFCHHSVVFRFHSGRADQNKIAVLPCGSVGEQAHP